VGGKNSRTLVINFPALTFFPQKVLKVSLIAFIQSEHQRIIKHFYSARVAIFIELSTPKARFAKANLCKNARWKTIILCVEQPDAIEAVKQRI